MLGSMSAEHASTPPVVTHDRDAHRFSAQVEGAVSVLEYRLVDDVMTIEYTGVPPAWRGHGIAAALVQKALATARRAGWKVVPACSYAAVWMQRHPEFDDLRA
jgi:predicted GNAT family acetyltransferase